MSKRRALDLACLTLLAVTGALLILIGPLLIASEFLSYGRPPCQSDELRAYAKLLLALVCMNTPAISVLKRLSPPQKLLGAVALPALGLGAYMTVAALSERGQAACRNRTLPEAMARCEANPNHYRQGKTANGYATLTLVTPGDTDAAFNCLQSWANSAREAPSIEIDESVYAAYRARR